MKDVLQTPDKKLYSQILLLDAHVKLHAKQNEYPVRRQIIGKNTIWDFLFVLVLWIVFTVCNVVVLKISKDQTEIDLRRNWSSKSEQGITQEEEMLSSWSFAYFMTKRIVLWSICFLRLWEGAQTRSRVQQDEVHVKYLKSSSEIAFVSLVNYRI